MHDNITFVHLTDIHIGNPSDPDTGLFSDTATTLRTVLAEITKMTPRPSFVIISGDLTHKGDIGSYAHFKQILAEADLDIPLVFALGNHDTRPGFYVAMKERSNNLDAPYMHDLVLEGIHIIVLDTSTPGFVGGSIESEQFEWLEKRLGEHTSLPKLIVTHHSPHLDENEPFTQWESIDTLASQRLRDLLVGRNILGILSGHIHLDRVSNWYGIPLFVGTGLYTAMDYRFNQQGLRGVAGTSYAVGTIRPSGLTMAIIPQPSDRRHYFQRIRSEMEKDPRFARPGTL
ncbi:metallophosphoesterase [Aquamicrobium defluvii]|uniref:Calcineurin-like phosphoesterase family protein n=1 Tax=Aquamicrobium defluvii TaxID=69279 RepID=A0A011U8F4_9HYPH|nr:metallophosphoesterase [Aquamicrobium defluvii]EXL02376.1 phosphohydrolase [Aquamicrobium defluvii]EZQ13130.1 phosphohydrolase [Halopseudomonas bauzanensis]TDR27829.1 calcineurin-like phosphoesterase family protein [Aquamicrobium defluvii]